MTTRLNALADRTTGQAFGLTNYDNNEADMNYLVVAGADQPSGATVQVLAEFFAVTGVTTITNFNDALGAVAGQQIRVWIKNGPLIIQNNGGGAGNIRTATGSDRLCNTGEIVEFAFDGTNWREQRTGPGAQVAYAVKTSNVTTTGTTFAAGADVLAAALGFAADGVSTYVADLFAPQMQNNGGSGVFVAPNLDAAQRGVFASSVSYTGLFGRAYLSGLAVGAHTINFRVFTAAATLTLQAGDGTGTNNHPAIVVVTRL